MHIFTTSNTIQISLTFNVNTHTHTHSRCITHFQHTLQTSLTFKVNKRTCTCTHTHFPRCSLVADTNLVLLENPVNPEHVVQHLIEEHQGNVQLLLIEHLQPGLDILPQFLPVHRKIVLGEPVAIENWARESNLWEMEGRRGHLDGKQVIPYRDFCCDNIAILINRNTAGGERDKRVRGERKAGRI